MSTGFILAAGFGTRLRPLTLELPKPVVPVGDRPLLAHVAQACRRGGLRHLIANAHHQHQKISAIINSYNLDIDVMVEDEIRGTAGGLAGARPLLQPGAVLVWNGDILTDAPVPQLLELAAQHDAQVLAVSPRPLGAGTVGLDDRGDVVRLRGQVFGRETCSGDYVGVMALGPSVVAGLPPRGCLFGDLALPQLARGARVLTVPSPAPWTDLGDLPAYVAANFAWLDARGLESYCAGSARVAESVLAERSLIGGGAVVSGSGRLRRVIAWPGAQVSAPLADAVVLGSGLIVPFSAEN